MEQQQLIIHALDRLENTVSALTDQVDVALASLAQDSTNYGAALATLSSGTAVLQGQLTAARAGQVADEAELQKALDALTAAHAALSVSAAPAPVVAAPVVAPVAPVVAPVAPVVAPVVAPAVPPVA